MDKRFEKTAFLPAEILLPRTGETENWAVVACDQFTSQPEHWQQAEDSRGHLPAAQVPRQGRPRHPPAVRCPRMRAMSSRLALFL